MALFKSKPPRARSTSYNDLWFSHRNAATSSHKDIASCHKLNRRHSSSPPPFRFNNLLYFFLLCYTFYFYTSLRVWTAADVQYWFTFHLRSNVITHRKKESFIVALVIYRVCHKSERFSSLFTDWTVYYLVYVCP